MMLVSGAFAGEIAVCPQPTPQRLAIAPVSASSLGQFEWWVDEEEAAGLVEERAYEVAPCILAAYNMELVERKMLGIAEAEQALAEDPYMDPTTFEQPGQGVGANWLLVVTVTRMSVEDKSVDVEIRGNSYHAEKSMITVWLQARIVNVGTKVVSPALSIRKNCTITTDQQLSLQSGEWDLGGDQRTDIVTDAVYKITDSGLAELLGQLLPKLGIRTGAQAGFRYDPQTGERISVIEQTYICPNPRCNRISPKGANFCPYCGARLDRPCEPAPAIERARPCEPPPAANRDKVNHAGG
ncbi:MAG: zinc ribbon domain-containing protein [Patescibacteria group bacterium]|jgi:hypothetical protein